MNERAPRSQAEPTRSGRWKSALRRVDRWSMTILAVGALGVAGLSWSASRSVAEEPPAAPEPAVAHDQPGTDVKRITITAEAVQRLGLRTAKVTEVTVGGKRFDTIPYTAVVYETNGDAWAYTQVAPLAFQRVHVTFDGVTNGMVLLTAGPPVGAEVVTVGAEELQGVEYGVGEE